MGNATIEIWTELGIGFVFVCLRLISRWLGVGFRNLFWDDLFIVLAFLFWCIDCSIAWSVGARWGGLANNGMTEEYRASLSPDSQEYRYRVGGSKTQLIGWSFYCTVLWSLKACWLSFYWRLGLGVAKMRLKCQIGLGLIATSFIATMLVLYFGCFPIKKHWQIYPDPGIFCYAATSPLQAIMVVSANVLTDFYIMAIPLPMIWGSSIPLRNKISLITIFCGGLITAVFAILRCILLLTHGETGPSISGVWAIRESFVAMVISNLPFLLPLFKRIHSKIYGTSSSKYNSTAKSGSVPLSNIKSNKSIGGYKRFGRDAVGDKSLVSQVHFGSEDAIMEVGKSSIITTSDKDLEKGNDIMITTEWQVDSHAEEEHKQVASRVQRYSSMPRGPSNPSGL